MSTTTENTNFPFIGSSDNSKQYTYQNLHLMLKITETIIKEMQHRLQDSHTTVNRHIGEI